MSAETETSPIRTASKSGPRRRWLTRVFPEGRAMRIELGDDRQILGRDLLEDNEASRRHVELTWSEELKLHRVRDLASKNGTHLDGRRIDADYLHEGSVLRIGASVLAYAELAVPGGFKHADRLDEALRTDPANSPARAYAELLADLAAPSLSPILIEGPSGSGKELLARRIHEKSGRSGELIAVNCATLSGELIASELFGHKRGAFSGAHEDRAGLFAAADRGTLFLDELGDLPPAQQPALLRALQERKIRPVGADREREIDVRIIAATHRELDALVARDQFRADLLARLSAVRIALPGLNRRREEIIPLLRSFLGAGELAADAAEALLIYDWPMNVRELEQLAARIKLLGESIELSALPPAILKTLEQRASSKESAIDRQQLVALLEKHRGNVAAVAAELGRHRQQLYRWLSAFKIDPASFRG